MASDFNKPLVTDTYSALVPALQIAYVDILRWLEPTLTGAHTNVPTGAIRLNAATNTLQKYNGTTWDALTFTVGSGTATTGLFTSLGASGNLSSDTRMDAPIYYDRDNTAYYANPAGVSNFSGLTVANTITGSVSGNAGTATALQTARTINGTSFNGTANIATTEWFHSGRDFPLGTLITTSIDYSVASGDLFVLEIKGNSYSSLVPFNIQVQGYIYSSSLINYGGYSTGPNFSITAMNVGGALCFWFPSQGYWQGFNAKVYSAIGTYATNKIVSITNVANPNGTKQVIITPQSLLLSGNYNSYAPTLTGGGASGTWGINITGSAGTAATVTSAAQPNITSVGATLSCATSMTSPDFYATGWFRSSGANTGLYNSNRANYIYSRAVNRWAVTGNAAGSNVFLDFLGTHESTYRGAIHAATDNTMGFLNSSDNWTFRVGSTGNAVVTGTISAINLSGTNTGDQANISGNAGSASALIGNGAPLYGTTAGESYGNLPQVRERNSAGAQGSSQTIAPGLGFHWGGVVASSIQLEPSGRISIRNNPGTSYEAFVCAGLTATTGSFSSTISTPTLSATTSLCSTFDHPNRTNGSMITTGNAGYLHLGAWGVGRTAAGAVLVNTAYTADVAATAGTCSGNSATATYAYNCNNWFKLNDNYGHAIEGIYNAGLFQGMFDMGPAYRLTAGGGVGNLYGTCWSHPNAGGAAANLDSHGQIVLINGGFGSCMSYSIKASANITAYSDERLKTNWKPLVDNYVARLAEIKTGTYDRIDQALTQVGVSAQSLETLLPEAVITGNDDMHTKSVSYGNAAMASSVMLARDLVDLRALVEQLKQEIDNLKKDKNGFN